MKKLRFIKNNEGVALIEFAIALPMLLILFIGMVELGNFIIQHQKVDKVASSMADFVAQGSTVSITNLNDFGLAVPQIMRPFGFTGTVIFSSASRRPSNSGVPGCNISAPCIDWQHRILGSDTSNIGSTGTIPILPGNYPVINNQNIIIAEVFLHYTPILSVSSNIIPAFTATTIYKSAIYKPRQGTLTTLSP